MNLTSLKRYRLIIPGIFIFVVIFFIFPNSCKELINNYNELLKLNLFNIVYLFLTLLFGAIYYITKIRMWFWEPFLKPVQDNIQDSLLNPFNGKFDESEINYLKDQRRLLNIFYSFVDNDQSLKEKANSVRMNGLLWTSFIDLTIICSISSIIIDIKLFLFFTLYNKALLFTLLITSFISFIMTHLLLKRHIALSNEQLQVIVGIHKKELFEKLENV
ncbi:MAG: hypothetical protein P4L45_00275 [Ignavibacteriaceae bacterium]|nr:hypothetical protein [Ignavibacteriaceae bacterium]